MALIRTVGHVLDKVDARESAGLKRFLTEKYREWK
jgi:hypothetical protein